MKIGNVEWSKTLWIEWAAWCALFLVVGVLGSLIIGVKAHAATLQWDRNAESDVSAYNVYGCFIVSPATDCTVAKNVAQLRSTVLQPGVGLIPSYTIPGGNEGRYGVTARDEINESGLSVSVPFDSVAPLTPVNPRLVQ